MNGASTTLLNISHLFTRTTLPTATQVESLLYNYAAKKSLTDIKKLHAHLITSGLLTPWESRYIPALLASGYALSGHIPYARQLFDKLHQRTKRSYNSMIKLYTENGFSHNALELFVEMLKSGKTKPDRLTYPFVVKSCAELSLLQFGLSVHGMIIHSGVDSNTFVGNSLLSMYMNFGKKDEARQVFDGMNDKCVVSWNTLISGYFKNGFANESLSVFKKMVDLKVDIDNATIVSILPACALLKELETGRKIHHLVKENNLDENLYVRNALIDMYVKCGQMEDARVLFNETSKRDVVTWTSMINGYIVNGDTRTAISLCTLMNLEGVNPNSLTLASLLSACADLKYLKQGKTFHGYAIKNNLDHDVIVETSLIDMYAKSNFITYSFCTFNKTSKTKTPPWNAVISGCIENGLSTKAILLFKQMRLENVGPNEATIKCVLPAYAITTNLKQVTNFHSYLIKSGFISISDLATGLIDIYAKSGGLEQAYKQFLELKSRDIVSWSVIISSYGKHGNGERAVTLFNEMIKSKIEPNDVTFTSVLHACSHSGLVDEGLRLFRMMGNYGIVPRGCHYTCVVDLLGRAGRVKEAYEMVSGMDFGGGNGNSAVWGALLGACAVHGEVEMGEVCAKRLFEMEPENTGNYVLLGNIYASVGRWEEAEKVRSLMDRIGLRKETARSFL